MMSALSKVCCFVWIDVKMVGIEKDSTSFVGFGIRQSLYAQYMVIPTLSRCLARDCLQGYVSWQISDILHAQALAIFSIVNGNY